jgi:dienelactone hydrolase
MRRLLVLIILIAPCAHAEIHRHQGSDAALAYDRFVHVVSEVESPVEMKYIKAKDGLYIAAAIRKPKGPGPFPAVIMFHGAPGGRGMDQLVGWSRGDTGGPVWERFLQEGFVVAVADYRGGDWNVVNVPSGHGYSTAIDDGLSVIEYVRQLAYVDAKQVNLYGASLGGNLVMFLVSKDPSIHAAILGAPAPIWFLGAQHSSQPFDLAKPQPDLPVAQGNIDPIRSPLLIMVGTEDRMLPIDVTLHDLLAKSGKQVTMDIYEHGYHDFVLGPQGQKRPDLKRGEILLPAALEALDRSVQFFKNPQSIH